MSGKTTGPSTGCLEVNSPTPSFIQSMLTPLGFASGYAIFGLGCCSLMIAAVWVNWREPDYARRAARLRQRVSNLCKWYRNYHTRFGQIAVEYHNPDHLGPGLIIANHPSLVDALWIFATQPHICCVMKADLMKSWLLRYLVSSLNYVSNQDPEQLLQECTERLNSGETLLVFPEATRTEPGTLPRFRLGAAELLIQTKVVAYPVVIHKRGSYLSKSRAWYQFPKERQRWHIDFAGSFKPTLTDNPRMDRRRVTAETEEFFHHRLRGHTLAPGRQAAEN